MFKKLFSIRTGLIVLFSLLMVSYIVLAVFYINSLYNASTASPTPPVDVVQRTTYPDGSTIKVPTVVTAGEPFIYETRGEKLVETGGTVSFQMACEVSVGIEQITPLGSIYSALPKGKFDIKRSYAIAVSTRLSPSDNCRLQIIAKYTFYVTDKDGSQSSFDVTDTAASNSFKLVVPPPEN